MKDKDAAKAKATRAADTLIEYAEHPERFCIICSKRIGVCEHTTDDRIYNLNEYAESLSAQIDELRERLAHLEEIV